MTDARAVVLTGPRAPELRSLPVPDRAPEGGAILRVLANGLCGSDHDLWTGRLTRSNPRLTPFPLVPGHEIVGQVHAIDPVLAQRTGIGEGDRVVVEARVACGECVECLSDRGRHCRVGFGYSLTSVERAPGLWGGMADFLVTVPGTRFYPVPDGLSALDASLFNALANALHWTVGLGGVGVGDRVLVLGPGQRGTFCALAAHEAGAAQVIVTGLARDEHKLRAVERFGATAAVNVETSELAVEVEERTGGRGVDVVVDTTPGATQPVLDGLGCLRPGGRLVLAGIKGQPIDGLSLDLIQTRELQVVGAKATSAWSVTQALRILADERYPFGLLHSHQFGLDGYQQAMEVLGGGVEGDPPYHITVVP